MNQTVKNETPAETAKRVGSSTVKDYKVEIIKLELIVPDENQPRRNFDPGRLADLQKSIKLHGIITPLVVERHGVKFLLVDGERRYKAALEVGLKEVPALIQEPKSGVDRMLQQFHIQEQHEGWSHTEKANAVIELAKALNLSVRAVSELLALPERTIGDYLMFGRLLGRTEFQKNQIGIKFASPIVRLRDHIKKQYVDQLNDEFDKGQERQFEHAIIHRIKSGDIRTPRDLVKLRDSITADPKVAERFIKNDEMSLDKMFLETHAKTSYYYRNLLMACRQVQSYITQGNSIGVDKLVNESEEAQKLINQTIQALGKMV